MKKLMCVLIVALSGMSYGGSWEDSGDVNSDGVCNVADLLVVRNRLGMSSNGLEADVNSDGIVNVADLLIVRNQLGLRVWEETPAPKTYYIQTENSVRYLWHPTRPKIQCYIPGLHPSEHFTKYRSLQQAKNLIQEYLWYNRYSTTGPIMIYSCEPISIWYKER